MEFPHLVEMHKKFANDDVVCISVTVDDPADKAAAFKFLKAKKATFSNYLLTEEQSVWQEKFAINGPPCVIVFDRNGKRVKKFDTNEGSKPYTYADVEQAVKGLFDKK